MNEVTEHYLLKKKHREQCLCGLSFVKLRIICKSVARLALADAIGWQNWKGTNEGTRKKRTSTESSLGDAGHTQQSCLCVRVSRIHNTFLIIDRFGVPAE